MKTGHCDDRSFLVYVEPSFAGLVDFIDADAVHHFDALWIAEMKVVIVVCVADDIVVVLVWADEGWVGWAEQGDEFAIEADGHVDGG